MQLFPNEEILETSNQDKIVLTSQRVNLNDKEWSRSSQVTLFLENISFVENIYKCNSVLLVIVALGLIVRLVTVDGAFERGLAIGEFALAVIFLLLWLIPQRQVVTISYNGGQT